MFLVMIQQIILGVSLAAPVGPINIEMVKRGIEKGFWHAWLVGLGGMTADIFFMMIIYCGLSSFFMYTYVQLSMYCIGFFYCFISDLQVLNKEFQSIRWNI
jgi:threonine/homoserine/homoserine lactone efflux protein